jgi:hypothetical protein
VTGVGVARGIAKRSSVWVRDGERRKDAAGKGPQMRSDAALCGWARTHVKKGIPPSHVAPCRGAVDGVGTDGDGSARCS